MRRLYSKMVVSMFVALTLVVGQSAVFNLNVNTWQSDNTLFGGSARISTDSGTTWKSVGAGQFRATFVGDVYDNYPQSWLTYCTDVNFPLLKGTAQYTPMSWSDAAEKNHSPLWTGGDTGLASSIYLTYYESVTSKAEAVGLQLAIWNALYNGSDWNTGLFQVETATAGALNFAASVYGNIDGLIPPLAGTWWMPIDGQGNQRMNQGLIGPTFPSQRVPEPGSTVASLLAGLLGLSALRRKLT